MVLLPPPFVVLAAAHALQRRQVCRMISKSNRQQRHCTRGSGAVALPPGDNMQIAYPLDAINHWQTHAVRIFRRWHPFQWTIWSITWTCKFSYAWKHMQSACIIPFDVPSRSGKFSRSTSFPQSQLHRDTHTKWCNIQYVKLLVSLLLISKLHTWQTIGCFDFHAKCSLMKHKSSVLRSMAVHGLHVYIVLYNWQGKFHLMFSARYSTTRFFMHHSRHMKNHCNSKMYACKIS